MGCAAARFTAQAPRLFDGLRPKLFLTGHVRNDSELRKRLTDLTGSPETCEMTLVGVSGLDKGWPRGRKHSQPPLLAPASNSSIPSQHFSSKLAASRAVLARFMIVVVYMTT